MIRTVTRPSKVGVMRLAGGGGGRAAITHDCPAEGGPDYLASSAVVVGRGLLLQERLISEYWPGWGAYLFGAIDHGAP